MSSDKLLDIYHEHYKETCKLSNAAQKRRNKSFVILCILEAISFMLIYNPALICGVLNETIKNKIETTLLLSNTVLQTLVWILIAYVLVRYVQDMLYVERQYVYLDRLEKQIDSMMGKDGIFNRESVHYLKNYPIALNLIDLFYKMFCPILFAGINVAHIIQEWKCNTMGLPIIVDSFICLSITIITWFYYFEIHTKTTEWCKKHIPGIRWISEKIRKILKEV